MNELSKYFSLSMFILSITSVNTQSVSDSTMQKVTAEKANIYLFSEMYKYIHDL